jgi:hypothetical protein
VSEYTHTTNGRTWRIYGCARRGCDRVNLDYEAFGGRDKTYCMGHIPFRSRVRLWWQEWSASLLSQPPRVDETAVAHEALMPRFTQTADVLAGKAAMAQSAAEAKDFADGALKCVQAIITLDPARLQGGDTAEARKESLPEPPRVPDVQTGTKDADKDGKIAE